MFVPHSLQNRVIQIKALSLLYIQNNKSRLQIWFLNLQEVFKGFLKARLSFFLPPGVCLEIKISIAFILRQVYKNMIDVSRCRFFKCNHTFHNETFNFCSTDVSLAADRVLRKFIRRFAQNRMPLRIILKQPAVKIMIAKWSTFPTGFSQRYLYVRDKYNNILGQLNIFLVWRNFCTSLND